MSDLNQNDRHRDLMVFGGGCWKCLAFVIVEKRFLTLIHASSETSVARLCHAGFVERNLRHGEFYAPSVHGVPSGESLSRCPVTDSRRRKVLRRGLRACQ